MIRELADADAETYVEHRRAALGESPLAFSSSPSDDIVSSPEAVREQLLRPPDSVILGAFLGPELVGTVGLYREQHVKSSHKAHLWGMYVVPAHRRRGVGAGLLQAVLAHARSLEGIEWVHLSVTSAADGARRLYERAGFLSWGTEPDSLRHDGRTVVEHHMALRLGGSEVP